MPYFSHNACTSVERVTTTRCNPSVTANARQSSGFPSNSASSLLEPNRFARPDAMITHPISLFIGEKLRIELFSCLFAGVTILLIAIEKLLCLVGKYAAAAAFAADFALGERKTEHLLSMTDESECLGVCHLHGLRGSAKRSGLLDGMQQTARSLTEKALAVLIEQRHADIWLHGGSFPTTFSFPLYFDIHNGIIADFVVK